MTHISLTAPIPLQKVLLATDFSEASVAAVGHAAAVARSYQGTVDVVHVIVPEVYWWAPPESLPSIEEGIEIWAEQKMKALLASERLRDIPHDGIIEHGEIWDVVRGHIGDTIRCFLLLLERHPVRPRPCSLLELRLVIPLSRR